MVVLQKTLVVMFAVCLCLVASSTQAEMLVHYTFDDVTGTTVPDHGTDAGDHAGTLIGDAFIATDAERGAVLELDGVDVNENSDHVQIGGPALDLNVAGSATIAAWIWTAKTGYPHQAIFSSGPMANLYFGVIPDPEDQFLANGGPTAIRSNNWADLLVDYHGRWTHVAVVMEGDMSYFYVDGMPFGSADRGGPIPAPTKSPVVGMDIGSLRWVFKGRIDDFRIYNEALSAEEIAAIVPEPSTLMLLAIGALVLLARRKR